MRLKIENDVLKVVCKEDNVKREFNIPLEVSRGTMNIGLLDGHVEQYAWRMFNAEDSMYIARHGNGSSWLLIDKWTDEVFEVTHEQMINGYEY